MAAHHALTKQLCFYSNASAGLRRLGHIRRHFSLSAYRKVIQKVDINWKNETIEVQFQNGNHFIHAYPYIFLQDNCLCSACFHESSKSRKKLMSNLNLKKTITEAVVNGKQNSVDVKWSDGHQSSFPENWLIERRFNEENRLERTTGLRDRPELFGSEYQIERANFNEVLSSPAKLCDLLKILCKNGVFILENAPTKTGQLKKFVETFGFIRTTHYGNEFTVKSERHASNIAYTSTTLGVHTDLPYYQYPPSVQILHCIKQYDADAEGGASHLVDGFQVAAQLRLYHPEVYKTLSTVPLEFADIGKDFTKFHKIHHSPTFVHDSKENLTRIVYSNQQLSSCMPVPIDQIKPIYQSLKLFTNLCYDPKNLMKFKLKEGDILVFDNWRLLHGREGFDSSKGERHVEGCYVDWDEVFSAIRVLETENLNHSSKNPHDVASFRKVLKN